VLFAPHRAIGASVQARRPVRRVVRALTGRGYAVATIHYRLVGEHGSGSDRGRQGPVRWLRANAARLGFSTDRSGQWVCRQGVRGLYARTTAGRRFDAPVRPTTARVQAWSLSVPGRLYRTGLSAVSSAIPPPFLGAGSRKTGALRRASPAPTRRGRSAVPAHPLRGDALVPVAQSRAFAAKLKTGRRVGRVDRRGRRAARVGASGGSAMERWDLPRPAPPELDRRTTEIGVIDLHGVDVERRRAVLAVIDH